MTYLWHGPQGHIAAAGKHWRAGDWDWTPEMIDYQPPRPKRVMLATCSAWGIPIEQMLGDKRRYPVNIKNARHAAQLLMRMKLTMSYEMIARQFHVDHTTVLYGCGRARKQLCENREFSDRYRHAIEILGPCWVGSKREFET